MKSIRGIITGLGLFILSGTLQTDLLAQSETPDSIVQLTAEAQGLSLMSRADLPPFGTYWLVMTRGAAPLPCPPLDQSLPIYAVTDGQFIVDGTGGQTTSTNDLMVEAATVVNLINQAQNVQSRRMARTMSLDGGLLPPGAGGGGEATNTYAFNGISFDTNQLWLELTNVSSGVAYANLHHATNQVYAIWSTTDLTVPFADWQVLTEVWPTDTNCQPFTLPTYGQSDLFLRAEDWTDVDSDGDGVPDWWAWAYWATTNVPTGLDFYNGSTFAEDYSNSLAPTVFQFTGIEVTNQYVPSSTVPVQLDVAGHPYYIATLIDDTNFADAVWSAYTSSNVMVNQGLTEGWHDVWIGLRGHGDDPTNAVWQWQRLKLDFTPPALIITSPTNSVVDRPVLQLQGYSPEALSSISYDLTNALGLVTNQQALITGQAYNTNTMEFTTNYFHCYDVPLTTGTNIITLHAMDLAGNVTVLTTNIVYIANTNPPAVDLRWPTDGMQMAGGSVTIQGQVNDPTATVSVTVSDAGGNTNSFNGRTGRDGGFWIENVALNSGTNYLTLTVSNAVASNNTNFNLIQTNLGLSVNAVAAGDTMVYGMIGTNGYTVWVNGNQATDNGSGTWAAQITPLCVGGGLVEVTAIPNTDNGGNGSGGGATVNPGSTQSLNIQAAVEPPQGVFVQSYHAKEHYTGFAFNYYYPTNDSHINWDDGVGGDQLENDTFLGFPQWHSETAWPTASWPQALPAGTNVWINGANQSGTNYGVIPNLSQEHCDTAYFQFQIENSAVTTDRRTADTEMRLVTGGPLGSKAQNLWVISGSATDAKTGLPIPYGQISIGSLGHLDTNGLLYVVLPDGDPIVTPTVQDNNHYTFNVGATEYHPYIKLSTSTTNADLDFDTPTICVGQQVTFSIGWSPYTPDQIADTAVVWTLSGTYVNTNSDPNCDRFYSKDATQLHRIQSVDGTTATSCWYVKDLPSGTVTVTLNVTLKNGQQKILKTSGQFNVFKPATAKGSPYQPDGTPTARILGGSLSLGVTGVTNDMSFRHTINPGGFSGQAGYVQLITSGEYTSSGTGLLLPPLPDTELDDRYGEFPRGEPSISANTNNSVSFQDGPAVGLFNNSSASMNVSFSTYLMFKPSGGIYVPLRLVTWSLQDEAADGALVNGAELVPAPSDDDCTAFPHWEIKWTGP